MLKYFCKIFGHNDNHIGNQMAGAIFAQSLNMRLTGMSVGKTKEFRCKRCKELLSTMDY